MMKLILATTSPSRIEVFTKLGIPFESEGSDVDEYAASRPSDPETLVKYLAKLKAEAVAKKRTEGIIIGFDSIGVFDGEILEKPTSREETFARLKRMSGKKHKHITGVHVMHLGSGKALSESIHTEVILRKYTDDEINYYLDHCNEKYKISAHGFNTARYYSMSFIESLQGDPLNIHGTPLSTIMKMLQKVGYMVSC